MARRKGMASLVNAIARDAARAQRKAETERKRQLKAFEAQKKAAERHRKQAELEARRQQAQSEKERKQLEKEAQQQYLADRMQETEDCNAETAEFIQALSTVLEPTLTVDDTIAFDSLRVKLEYPSFSPPQELTRVIPPPNEAEYLKKVKAPGLLENALGMKGRYQREMQAAKQQYSDTLKAYEAAEAEKKAKLEQLRAEYGVVLHKVIPVGAMQKVVPPVP